MAVARAYGANSFEEEKRMALERAHRLKVEGNSLNRCLLFEEFCRDLKDASLELRSDFEVACEHINHYASWVLRCASDSLKENKDIVLRAVQLNPWALKFAGECPRADREVVLEAVKKDGQALRFASKELRNDRDVVLAAVRQAVALDAARMLPKQPQDIMLRVAWSASLDWNARAVYSEAGDRLRTDLPLEDFLELAKSSIAARGDCAPVVSVTLRSAGTQFWEFEVAMLSGTVFPCILEPRPGLSWSSSSRSPSGISSFRAGLGSSGPTLEDLAQQILQLLPRYTQVLAASRLHIVFAGQEDPMSPWDAKRPLGELCLQH